MGDGKDQAAVTELLTRARDIGEKRYGALKPTKIVECYAPGRVNLIGEHTDYEEGFVCPFAINLGTLVHLRLRPPSESVPRFRIFSEYLNEEQKFDKALPSVPEATAQWWSYVVGSLHCFVEAYPNSSSAAKSWFTADGAVEGFDMVLVANMPVGGGLSSSASVEMALVKAMEVVTSTPPNPTFTMEKVAQRAEHQWAKMPCGLMDQAIVALAHREAALLFDCRSKATKDAVLPAGKVAVIVFDSGVKHSLVSGEYKERRESCAEAVRHVSSAMPEKTIKHLRDVESTEWLDKARTKHQADSGSDKAPVWYRRGQHVVNENRRCQEFVEALAADDFVRAGRLMNESHMSLKDLFEVTVEHTDKLSELARGTDGVYGARMTGGGFGGSVVALCDAAKTQQVQRSVDEKYHEFWAASKSSSPNMKLSPPKSFIAFPCDGARLVQ